MKAPSNLSQQKIFTDNAAAKSGSLPLDGGELERG
jgi:hypothetical protein